MKKYYLTVNPHGGIKKGKEILTKVVPLFDNANIALTIIETEYAGHARDLAKELPMDGYNGFCCIGGDGTLHESMFTLFRILTGEDWTDVRYNLIAASDIGLIDISKPIITFYHVLWFCVSAFLLLNLLVGAILNNYSVVREEMDNQSKKE